MDGPFEDPFEAMSNDFGPGANFDLFNPFDYTEAQLEELFMDDLGRILNQLEDGIEHSQPIPPEQQTPQVPDTLIGPLGASPDVFSAAEQNNEEISSEQTTADMPPLPYFIEESQPISPHKPPRPPVGRIGRRGVQASEAPALSKVTKNTVQLRMIMCRRTVAKTRIVTITSKIQTQKLSGTAPIAMMRNRNNKTNKNFGKITMSGEKDQKITLTIFEQPWVKRRYLLKDKNGKVMETPEQMFRRVANTIAAEEAKYGATDSQVKALADELYELTSNGVFLFNSPTLMNAGRKNGVLSACFVLEVSDSVEEIFETEKNAAVIQKAGGGTGFCFDKLRPTGDLVLSTGGTTSGPISFMRAYSEGTSAIQQGAFRRGANMGMLSIWHPDILNFIRAKRKLGVLDNFNLSVKVTDEFMERLQNDPQAPHVVINPRTKKKYVIPRSIGTKPYTINDLVPEDKK